MARYLFLAFTVIPVVELYLLISVGRQVGALPTVAFVVGTGLLGAVLARREGLRVLRSWTEATARGRLPEDGILSGALVLVGAVLLISPGVLTDVTGLFLLVPPTRRWVAARLRRALERRMKAGTLRVTGFRVGGFHEAPGPRSPRQPGEADAEFSEENPRR